jgi:antitoxin (DNA-binding transcriptional repressor) of toxin-antitoxin stability system
MKFVTVRELRSKTALLRKDLAKQEELVLTANGRPFAVVTAVHPDGVEEDLLAIRRARARLAIERIRTWAEERGLDKMTMDEIDQVIADVRRDRMAKEKQGR